MHTLHCNELIYPTVQISSNRLETDLNSRITMILRHDANGKNAEYQFGSFKHQKRFQSTTIWCIQKETRRTLQRNNTKGNEKVNVHFITSFYYYVMLWNFENPWLKLDKSESNRIKPDRIEWHHQPVVIGAKRRASYRLTPWYKLRWSPHFRISDCHEHSLWQFKFKFAKPTSGFMNLENSNFLEENSNFRRKNPPRAMRNFLTKILTHAKLNIGTFFLKIILNWLNFRKISKELNFQ